MASLGHVAVGMALGRIGQPTPAAGRARWMIALSLAALAPDLDVLAFRLGIPYSAEWGHRGAAHSLAIALAAAALVGAATRSRKVWLLATLALSSHGLLDTLTDGGLGVALLWPFRLTRYFAPLRPIPVAPIGARFLSSRGMHCAVVELALFAPLWIWSLWPARRPAAEVAR